MSRASTLAKAVGSNGDITVSGNTTLGDAAGDNLIINASTASIPNNLNFTGKLSTSSLANTQKALMTYLLPSTSDGWRGIYRSGFDWWSRNQQWGGPWGGNMVDGATGTLYNVEFATGYIDNRTTQSWVGYDAVSTYAAQGFKVSETQTVADIWVKLYKSGNPTNNLGVFVYSDTGGSPNTLITNGTATAQSGKLHTSDSNGQWYRFVFPTPPSLTGGTQYHIVLKSSGAVDLTNYWYLPATLASTYPFGNSKRADATPTWGAASGALYFLVELSDSAKILQSSGQFDGKLAFGGDGASGVLNMSRGLCSSVPLHNLVNTTEGTIYLVGTALTKNATILDIGYGENHDRIVLRSNVSTGYLSGSLYESGGTLTTVTATATDISSGTHSIGIYWRAKNDGADRIDIFVDGTTYSSSTSLSLDFDYLMEQLGTMWVGGGFALAPTYSGSSIGINGFSGLPSTLGWTYNGGATEGNAFSVSGGKLYQNKNGYASTDAGRYTKAWAASNTNGYNIAVKQKVTFGTNLAGTISNSIYVQDATKFLAVSPQEYFTTMYSTAGVYPQLDNKSYDNVNHIVTKGSDGFLFVNRKLIVDYSAAVTSADATNQLMIGDSSAVAGENADVIHSYWNYYITAWSPPQFTSGSISELAIWQGNQKAMWPLLYNAGTQISGKTYMGIGQNYLDKSGRLPALVQRGITSAPTSVENTVSPSTLLPEMERFVIAEEVDGFCSATLSGSAASNNYLGSRLDGVLVSVQGVSPYTGTAYGGLSAPCVKKVPLGLHKVSGHFSGNGVTVTALTTLRELTIRPKL